MSGSCLALDREKGEITVKIKSLPILNKNTFGQGKTQALKGFTLAEVLIVVGLLGVVTAATLGIVNYVQDVSCKTAYKKSYSVAQQALTMANTKDLLVPSIAGYTNPPANFLAFMSQFKVTKQCTSSNNTECWDNSGEKYVNGNPDATSYAFIDSSGMAWIMYYLGESEIFVDTNGFKKPNQWGKDRFAFYLYGANKTKDAGEVPVRIIPYRENDSGICYSGTVCGVKNNYYGRSWLDWKLGGY